jgi:hypothetical protein
LLYRLESEPATSAGAAFADVDASSWFASAAAWANEQGLVRGYEATGALAGEFGGDDAITREQMATIMYRYAAWAGLDTSARADLGAYVDAEELTFGEEAMSWCVAAGLIGGYEGTAQLGTQNGATRAEAAVVIQRLIALTLA